MPSQTGRTNQKDDGFERPGSLADRSTPAVLVLHARKFPAESLIER